MADEPNLAVSASKIAREPGAKAENNNNTKAFGGVLVILAVVAGMYAIIQPMNQQMGYLKDEINLVKARLAGHQDVASIRDSKITADLSAVKEKFVKAEAEHQATDRRISDLEEWRIWWNRSHLVADTENRVRIEALERHCYSESYEGK